MTDPVSAIVEQVSRTACEADGIDPLDEATRRRLDRRGLDGVTAWTDDGGFALRYDDAVDLVVAPAARRHGLGGRLASEAVATPGSLTAWSHGDHPAAAALAQRHGFERTRELWVMRRPASDPLPAVPAREGITVRGYRDTDVDEVLRVNAAAFAHHPEQGGMDADDLRARMASSWFEPAGLLVADTGTDAGTDAGTDTNTGLAGFHWTKRHDASLGEVYVVGIDPAAQGRGLGRVLTLAGLHHLRGLGVDEVLLYVESDNAPAVALYGGLGFTHAAHETHVQYRRS